MAEEDLVVDFVLVVAVVVVVPFLFLECLVPILYDGVGVLVCDCAVVVSWVQEVKSILNTVRLFSVASTDVKAKLHFYFTSALEHLTH